MKKATMAGIVAVNAEKLAATPLGLPIGSQIWPTRTMLNDFPAYVKMMADIGVTRLELCSPVGYGAEFAVLANGREVAKILNDHGVHPPAFVSNFLFLSVLLFGMWAIKLMHLQKAPASVGPVVFEI